MSMTPLNPYQLYVLSLGGNGKPTGILPIELSEVLGNIKELSGLEELTFIDGTTQTTAFKPFTVDWNETNSSLPSFIKNKPNLITDYQPTLVSGTNIKTVNGLSLLGSGNIQIDSGVTSFNTRTGAVLLSSEDVATALGFTPYDAGNPSGYITSSGVASNVSGTVAVANGGTGATTANAAFNTLVPSQTGNSGKYLTTNGTNTSWADSGSGTVTSVSGAGTVNGLTLTGAVTSSGSLTLGGTLNLSEPPAIGGTTPNTGVFTNLTVNDNTILGSNNTDTVNFNARVNSDIDPSTNNAYDLGRNAHAWRNLFLTGTANIAALTASGTVTLSSGTANAIPYLNTSKVLTTGSALTFDGTNNRLGVVGTGYSPNIALSDAATIAWDTAAGQVATFTFVSSNRTVGAPSRLVSGAFYALAVIQNAGSNTLSWNAVFKWANGTAPILSTAPGARDYFVFRSDGTNLHEQGRSQGVV